LSDRSQTAQKALETIPQLCDRFRQSVLAAAFRGDLTADWREKNSDVEPASQLLLKIIENRQQKYNEECEELLLQNKKPPKLANFEVVNINFDIPEHWITISVEYAI
jgi:type I restriction enzyme S subunit